MQLVELTYPTCSSPTRINVRSMPSPATIAEDRDFFGIYYLFDLVFLRGKAGSLWDLASSYREFSTAAAYTFKGRESRLRNRRTEQLRALRANDRLLLADRVVSGRRRMIDRCKPVLEERGLGFGGESRLRSYCPSGRGCRKISRH